MQMVYHTGAMILTHFPKLLNLAANLSSELLAATVMLHAKQKNIFVPKMLCAAYALSAEAGDVLQASV